jgi:BirA family biotin operon repressor/biotin-[acetyl-CoA-carboxylase] ligase
VTERAQALLRELSDGRRHSGEQLAARLGVTRAAVWKQIHSLHQWGLTVHAVRGRGYRLAEPIDWLEASAIAAALRGRCQLAELTIHLETDSTNQRLLEAPVPAPGSIAVCLAEFQRAGRGRRGRSWTAPLGSGVCLSVAWQFEAVPRDFSALTLAVGVIVRRVLAAVSGADVALKWPNDLLHGGRKLGGILVEGVSEAHGPCLVVIGVGLNVALPQGLDPGDSLADATDLRTVCAVSPSRNALVANLIAELERLLTKYAAEGFSPYRGEWQQADCLRGREVSIHSNSGVEVGVALGIDADGALLVAPAHGRASRVLAGDVRVRSRA